MMYELIRSFAYENFGSDYHVAPQGHNKAIQPLALVVKENLSCWRRATRRPKKIALEVLDAYLANDKIVRSNVTSMMEGCLQKDRILTVRSGTSANSTRKYDVEFGEAVVGLHTDRHTLLGELNLSSVQEEYYTDLQLRNILSNAKLDPSKMEPYEKSKLYIITGVVYSEKMQIDGKREENDTVGAQVKFLPRVHWLSRLAQFKAGMSLTEHPAPPVERDERSPLLFTFAKVKYNQENCCLELQQIVGAKLKRKSTLDVVADSVADSLCSVEMEVMVTTREQWIYEDLMEISENKTERKLGVITRFLEETDSLQDMSLRARKYKNLVDRISKTDKMAIQIECPLSANDSNLLQATGVEIEYHTLNKSKTLRISAHNRAMVLDFAQIFFHLQGIQEEEWRFLKEFCGNPIYMEEEKNGKKDNKEDKEVREEREENKCKDVIENGRITKEDICGKVEEDENKKDISQERLVQEDLRKENKNTDEKGEDICNELLIQEDTSNGVKKKNENTDRKEEDICEEECLVQLYSQNGVEKDNKIAYEKEEDISQEEHLVHG